MRSCKLTSRGSLWKVSVDIAPEAEDVVGVTLAEIFAQPAAIYSDIEKRTVVASIFVSQVTVGQRVRLHEALLRIREAGINLGGGRVSWRRIRRENWAESWKRHFKPLHVSNKLLVVPSWSKHKAAAGQAVVILDPGLSFGTGHHPTTGFCLACVAQLRDPAKRQSLLDFGTGSGILSIAAAKLGYTTIEAIDFDPDAVRVAKENAAMNGTRLGIFRKDLCKLPLRSEKRFDVVCANLIHDLLIQERRRILNRLAPQGTLVLAGILKEQFTRVRESYEEAGAHLVKQRTVGEWHSGAFRISRDTIK